MEEYTLVNRFTERYKTKRYQKVRSRKVPSLVLKKKRECDGDEEEGAPMRGHRHKGTSYTDVL
jgi:hypothetical protein